MSSKIEDTLRTIENSIITINESMKSNKNRLDSNASRVNSLVIKHSDRSRNLFQLLHQTSRTNRAASSVALANPPLIESFKYATGKDLGSIACVCRRWRDLSSEISVLETVWVSYARQHYPDIYINYIDKYLGKSVICCLVKQQVKKQSTATKIDGISTDIEKIQNNVDNLKVAIAIESVVVVGVGLSLLPLPPAGFPSEYDINFLI